MRTLGHLSLAFLAFFITWAALVALAIIIGWPKPGGTGMSGFSVFSLGLAIAAGVAAYRRLRKLPNGTTQERQLAPSDYVLNFVRSMYGRLFLIIAALTFVWRAGYYYHFGLFENGSSRWYFKSIFARTLTDIESLGLAVAETVLIMAAICTLSFAVRWAMRGTR